MRSIPLSNVLNLLMEMRRKSELCVLTRGFKRADYLSRQKLLEILNSGLYASPIIVFVNQKKTADMVAKDLSRAGVSFIYFNVILFKAEMHCLSGMRQHCTLAKTKSSEKHHYSLCVTGNRMCLLLLILQDVVLMFRMSVLLSISRWPIRLKLMCIALVGLPVYVCVERC